MAKAGSVRLVSVLGFVALLLPHSTLAQGLSGTIAGVARDATGAVLPGVTVEAASPALIEKVRTAVTDSQGQYKLIELRPGTYTVTFTLPGFSTFKREGLELTTGITATVNAEMRIGALEETVTVTGASPTVDVQNARTQSVLTRQVLDTLPTNKSLAGYSAITLGATRGLGAQDVGGDKGETAGNIGIHGASAADAKTTIDGLYADAFGSGNGAGITWISQMAISEVTLSTRANNAEGESGGVLVNHVLKDGGNTFSVSLTGSGANSSMQAKTLTDDLRARGVTTAPSIKRVWDYGAGMGGPVRQDGVWFYASFRHWGAQNFAPGNYYQNRTDPTARGGLIYVPDLSRPAYTWATNEDYSGRMTWQASGKQKVAGYVSYQRSCNCYLGVAGVQTPEGAGHITYRPVVMLGSWTYPRTNRLLFEAGVLGTYGYDFVPRHDASETDIPVTDLTTGRRYNAYGGSMGPDFLAYGDFYNHVLNERFATSYVTGSHAFKVGFHLLSAWQNYTYDISPIEYQVRSGVGGTTVPAGLRQWAMPQHYRSRVNANLGIYAQDQWTIDRLTLNVGVRFDYLNSGNPAFDLPAGPFVPARSFPAVKDVPNWRDVSPRLGAAYDLFGDGKTAIKAHLGRFVRNASFSIANENNLAYRITTNATRSWADANGNWQPDCDLVNVLANGECGTLSNINLGRNILTTTYSDDFLRGNFVRPYTWEMDVTGQHELRPGIGLQGGFYSTWYGNFPITSNRLVTANDFDPYCVTLPTSDARLTGAGSQLCGFFDLNPAKFGQVDNFVVPAEQFGEMTQRYVGFDVGLRARFGQGGLLQGGMAAGRTTFNDCLNGLGANPQAPRAGVTNVISFIPAPVRFLPKDRCRTTLPFSAQSQFKFSANYPLPWYGIQVSGVFQNLAGVPIQATWAAPNAVIAPSLGRNLSGNLPVATIDLLVPNTEFEKRLTQVDLRLTKNVKLGRTRLQGNFDLYNLFNARTILSVNTNFGPLWPRPTSVLGGRLIKLGGQLDF